MAVGYRHKTCVLTVMQPVAAAEWKPHYIEVNVSEHRTQTSQEERLFVLTRTPRLKIDYWS